jgi:hypothetical protein
MDCAAGDNHISGFFRQSPRLRDLRALQDGSWYALVFWVPGMLFEVG